MSSQEEGGEEPSEPQRRTMLAAAETLANLAISYAAPVLMGVSDNGTPQHTASGFVVVRPSGRYLLTAHHVIRRYEQLRNKDPNTPLQLGNLRLNPLSPEEYAYEDEAADIIALTLRELDLKPADVVLHEPAGRAWPPPTPNTVEDSLLVSGMPNVLQWHPERHAVDHGAYALLTRVTSVNRGAIICQLHREDWIRGGAPGAPDPGQQLGGISGGPALRIGRAPDFPIVGLVSQYLPEYELLRISSLAHLPSDFVGTGN